MKKNIFISCFVCILVLFFSCASNPAPAYHSQSELSDLRVSETASRSMDAPNEDRMIAYTASLELTVKDKEETSKKINEQVKNNNGFIVRETENSIVARIPSANMDDYLKFAKTLGKVERETRTGTDITDQYMDNVLRMDNLKNVRNRYLTLLNQANSISDILAIEKELERVNLEIERLEGRIQYAQQSVAYSNVTIRFREKSRPGPVGWVFYGLYHGVKWLFVWD